MKILFLVPNINALFYSYVKDGNVDVGQFLVKQTLFYRILKKIPFIYFFSFGKWKKHLKNYDKIISMV